MKIDELDYFVIVTENLDACLHFYQDLLQMKHGINGQQHYLSFGRQKINIHTFPGEFEPSAQYPGYGTNDFCLITTDDLEDVKKELQEAGVSIVQDVCEKVGARGAMHSLYVYDPDGNLVEIAKYDEE